MGGLRRIRNSHELAKVGVAGAGDETLGTIDNIIVPCRTARVFIEAGSEPASGSVCMKQSFFSPRMIGSIKRFF